MLPPSLFSRFLEITLLSTYEFVPKFIVQVGSSTTDIVTLLYEAFEIVAIKISNKNKINVFCNFKHCLPRFQIYYTSSDSWCFFEILGAAPVRCDISRYSPL